MDFVFEFVVLSQVVLVEVVDHAVEYQVKVPAVGGVQDALELHVLLVVQDGGEHQTWTVLQLDLLVGDEQGLHHLGLARHAAHLDFLQTHSGFLLLVELLLDDLVEFLENVDVSLVEIGFLGLADAHVVLDAVDDTTFADIGPADESDVALEDLLLIRVEGHLFLLFAVQDAVEFGHEFFSAEHFDWVEFEGCAVVFEGVVLHDVDDVVLSRIEHDFFV
mmetsp:Transcript_44648/g.97488  ORF Transcript_44648/g.97488 Transcript_44648/m.97488 type:complete len:219 (+) Transcript_44648:668-1324(+)